MLPLVKIDTCFVILDAQVGAEISTDPYLNCQFNNTQDWTRFSPDRSNNCFLLFVITIAACVPASSKRRLDL